MFFENLHLIVLDTGFQCFPRAKRPYCNRCVKDCAQKTHRENRKVFELIGDKIWPAEDVTEQYFCEKTKEPGLP